MKCLITGSNGSAASYLADYLKSEGEVRVLGLSKPECDLRDRESVCRVLDSVKPDVVFHLASKADVKASFDDEGLSFSNNVDGTLNLFEGCRRVNIRPIIQICSTSEVYGQPHQVPITEDHSLSPVNPYAASKASQEMIGRCYASAYGFRVVITRAFGYINPKREGIALSSFAKQIAEIEKGRREVLEHGNLDSIRTFCDVRDIVRGYTLAIGWRDTFNIGAEYPISIGQCLKDLMEMSKVEIKLRLDPGKIRPTDVTKVIPDCSRFRRTTGWEPQILLRDSLKWLLDHWRYVIQ